MIYYVDVDETICEYLESREYHLATPIRKNIKKINSLYAAGHEVIYWTARGSTTGIDWSALTIKQLADWDAQYSDIQFGKPFYDFFIDDKAINSEDYFS